MAERPSRREPASDATSPSETELSADQIEQRQRLDGGLDEAATVADSSGQPLTADVLEQRQRRDGSIVPGAVDDAGGDAPSADVLEQRQVVESDDEDDDRRSE